MSDVSSAIRLPVALIAAATSRDSLFPTVIVIVAAACELASVFELPPFATLDAVEPHEAVIKITAAQINILNREFHIK